MLERFPASAEAHSLRCAAEQRAQFLKTAAANGFIIVEDDYEFETSFLAPPSPPLRAFDRGGRVLYIGSFSKTLFPGLGLGYLVAPAPVIREARALRALMLRHPCRFVRMGYSAIARSNIREDAASCGRCREEPSSRRPGITRRGPHA